MPRRGSSFGGSRTSSPPRNTATAQAPPKQVAPQVQAPPVQAQPQGGLLSGMAGTLMSGMAFGAGSEVAHQTIRGLMGGNSGSHEQHAPVQQAQPVQNTQQKPSYCDSENQRFVQCLKDYSDISMCQTYMDLFKECQKKYGI